MVIPHPAKASPQVAAVGPRGWSPKSLSPARLWDRIKVSQFLRSLCIHPWMALHSLSAVWAGQAAGDLLLGLLF